MRSDAVLKLQQDLRKLGYYSGTISGHFGSKTEAAARYDAWAKSVGPDHRAAFAPALSAWRNWQPQILAYFDHPHTSNGPTEAINGRLEHLRGSALGFRNLTNYIARCLLETGGFRPQLHPQIG